MMRHGVEGDAGGFGKWDMPETSVILAPLENGRFCTCDSYVIAVIHCDSLVAFVENGNVTIIGNGSDTE